MVDFVTSGTQAITAIDRTVEAVDTLGNTPEVMGEALYQAVDGHVAATRSNGTIAPDTRQLLMTMALEREVSENLINHLFTHGITPQRQAMQFNDSPEMVKIAENRENAAQLGFTVLRVADEQGKPAYLSVLRQGNEALVVGDVEIGALAKRLDVNGIHYVNRKDSEASAAIDAAYQKLMATAKTDAKEAVFQRLKTGDETARYALLSELRDDTRQKLIAEILNARAADSDAVRVLDKDSAKELTTLLADDPSHWEGLADNIITQRDYPQTMQNVLLHRLEATEEAKKKLHDQQGDKSLQPTDDSVLQSHRNSLGGMLTSGDFTPSKAEAELAIPADVMAKALGSGYRSQVLLQKLTNEQQANQSLKA